MSYFLNGIDLETTYGFIPVKQTGSDLALSGFLDLPSRLGKCFQSWGASHGVEPYTSASEIRLGGRDMKLQGVITGADRQTCIDKLQVIYTAINAFNSLVPFASPWNTHLVYVQEPVIGEYIADNGLRVTITLREPEPVIGGILPTATVGNDYGIDGIEWATMGAVLIDLTGDRRNRTAAKEGNYTAYRKEGYQITKTEEAKLSMRLFIKQSTYAAFASKIGSLQQLFTIPGERNLIVKEDLQRRVFACNGFRVTDIRNNDGWYGFLNIDLIQSQLAQTPTYLGDNSGNYITDNLNNKILLKWA